MDRFSIRRLRGGEFFVFFSDLVIDDLLIGRLRNLIFHTYVSAASTVRANPIANSLGVGRLAMAKPQRCYLQPVSENAARSGQSGGLGDRKLLKLQRPTVSPEK
jgi:hypothetical protein